MERMGVRLVAIVLCVIACVAGSAPSAFANGAPTIAKAPSIKFGAAERARIYAGAFFSGYSVAYWNAPLVKGDRVTIATTATGGDTPPCQMLYLPGTDDNTVGGQTPILDPASQTRHGPRDFQRFTTVEQTGTYVLAMTNLDSFLSSPHQCLAADPGRPFTFTVNVSHRGGASGAVKKGGTVRQGASGRASTRVVAPGQSLWAIAEDLVGVRAGIARIVGVVGRLWALNAERIGTGDPNLIYPGQTLIYRRP
jgi:LysM domain